MTSPADLVERLRATANGLTHDLTTEVMYEAADEIERLVPSKMASMSSPEIVLCSSSAWAMAMSLTSFCATNTSAPMTSTTSPAGSGPHPAVGAEVLDQ